MSAINTNVPPSDSGSFRRDTKALLVGVVSLSVVLWFSSRTLLSTNFLPHWYCFVGKVRLLWTNVIADLLIGLSYGVISCTLAWIVRRARAEGLQESAFPENAVFLQKPFRFATLLEQLKLIRRRP